MNPTMDKFQAYVHSGDIQNMKPIPMVFTFAELEYLYNAGMIVESDNKFLAVLDP